jgi:hypothetical protein
MISSINQSFLKTIVWICDLQQSCKKKEEEIENNIIEKKSQNYITVVGAAIKSEVLHQAHRILTHVMLALGVSFCYEEIENDLEEKSPMTRWDFIKVISIDILFSPLEILIAPLRIFNRTFCLLNSEKITFQDIHKSYFGIANELQEIRSSFDRTYNRSKADRKGVTEIALKILSCCICFVHGLSLIEVGLFYIFLPKFSEECEKRWDLFRRSIGGEAENKEILQNV